jgi:hypothetical protein
MVYMPWLTCKANIRVIYGQIVCTAPVLSASLLVHMYIKLFRYVLTKQSASLKLNGAASTLYHTDCVPPEPSFGHIKPKNCALARVFGPEKPTLADL